LRGAPRTVVGELARPSVRTDALSFSTVAVLGAPSSPNLVRRLRDRTACMRTTGWRLTAFGLDAKIGRP